MSSFDDINEVNERLREKGAAKPFVIPSERPCLAGGDPAQLVDLVLVIYSDDSMGEEDKPKALNDLLSVAVEAVKAQCPGILRDVWLGIEGSWGRRWPDINFQPSYRTYLFDNGLIEDREDERLVIRRHDRDGGSGAVIDLVNFFDWRPGAARLILLLGDSYLGKIIVEGQEIDGPEALQQAISTAQENEVTVYTYGALEEGDSRVRLYTQLATETGGQVYIGPPEQVNAFQPALADLVCQEAPDGNGACSTVQLPELRPCFTLRWGNDTRDQIETDDVEGLCIIASNPYENVILKDVTIVVTALTHEGQPVANLPDGTPSVEVAPSAFIHFGDLPPCQNGQPGEITREALLVSRGASEGDYMLTIDYCYSAELTLQDQDQFKLQLVES